MKKIFTLIALCSVVALARAQNVGIGTTTPQAKLDISATNNGVLLPRVSLTATNNFAPLALSPNTSTLVYNTATAGTGTTAVTPGFYYWDGTLWVRITDASATSKDWTVANTTVTPATTANNQYVSGNVGIGNFAATTPTVALDVRTTDAVKLPAGTTAQRPGTALAGATRFNSDLGVLEYYDGAQWQSVNAQVPIGTITSYGGSTPPPGWLLCDGSAQSTTGTYAALYGVIGYTYGGAGSTFNLPDLRGKAAFGLSGVAPYNTLGLSGGTTSATPTLTHNLQFPTATINTALPNHTHTIPGHSHGFSLNTVANTSGGEAGHTHSIPGQTITTSSGGTHQHGFAIRSDDGGYAAGVPNAFYYGQGSGAANRSGTTDRGPSSASPAAANGLIQDAGLHSHTATVAAVTSGTGSSHSHSIPALSVSGTVGTAGTSGDASFNSGNPSGTPTIPFTIPTTGISGSVTSPTINTYDPYQVVNYIIKATNVAAAGITSVSLSSGTLGQTLYNNGSNWTPTSNLYNAGGNIGINTTTPLSPLDVKGSQISSFTGTQRGSITDEAAAYVNGSFTALDFINDAGNNPTARIASQANAAGTKLYFGTSNNAGTGVTNSAMVISETGNVGIGTTTPANNLNVANSATSQALNVDLSGTDPLLQIKAGSTGNWTRIGSNGSNLAFLAQGSDKTATTNALVNMMILNTGNVGVATVSPSQRLEIGSNGGLGFSGTSPVINPADKKLYSPADGDLEWMTNNAAGAHGFAVSNQGTRAVYLNTSGNSYLNGGNVGIGIAGPANKLDVSGAMAVGSYAGTAAPANGMIVSGAVGIGYTSPSQTLDVNGNIRSAGSHINGSFDFILGNGDQVSRGNSGLSRALVKNGNNTLDVNYGNDFAGGTRIGSLTNGTAGNRIVYSDNSGLLTNSPSNGMVAMLYGTIHIGDVGGTLTINTPTGIVSGALSRYSSSNDAAVTVNLSQSISSYLPMITLQSTSPGSNTSASGQWNNDNDVAAVVGNFTSTSFDVYLREISSNTQNLTIIVGIMVLAY